MGLYNYFENPQTKLAIIHPSTKATTFFEKNKEYNVGSCSLCGCRDS